ncbi:MAG: hypothetical protein Q7K26_06765 [bacterium]|nr:hypothetical protein [bacterium]
MDKHRLAEFKNAIKEIASDPEKSIPDQEAFELIHQIVPWPAAEVGVFNSDGELLLHHRHFKEWPGEWAHINGWYIPGGYMKPGGSLEDWCHTHLRKDGMLSPVHFLETCGVIKWMPGEHPFSNLISIACVCMLEKDTLEFRPGEENRFRFFNKAVDSPVPHHTELQEMFFKWRDAHPESFR